MADLEIRVDPAEFRRVVQQAKTFDRRLYTQLRRRMRAAAKPVVDDIKRELTSGGASRTGMRQGIAAGTKVTVSNGRRAAGVVITTSPAKLPANKRAMAKAWNRSTFRHPVFGDRGVWRTQAGRPYFARTIARHRGAMDRAVLAALQDVTREMESRR